MSTFSRANCNSSLALRSSMLKRFLLLITFTCGMLIVFAIGTSSFHSYQAVEQLIPEQRLEVAQTDSSEEEQVRNCEQKHVWEGTGIRARRVLRIETPVLCRNKPPSCYRSDWDLDGDGVMEVIPEGLLNNGMCN